MRENWEGALEEKNEWKIYFLQTSLFLFRKTIVDKKRFTVGCCMSLARAHTHTHTHTHMFYG